MIQQVIDGMIVCMMTVFFLFGNKGVLVWSEPPSREAFYRQMEESVERVEHTAVQLSEERAKQEKRINQYLETQIAEMTLEQKLAQMMILTNEKDIKQEVLTAYQPGGIIFFGVDFQGKTISEVRSRVDRLQSYMEIPLFVGVDEEGGDVTRVAGLKEDGIPVFKSARELSEAGMDAVAEETTSKMRLLKEMGINLNFDPVADVVENPKAYMYMRSISSNPDNVAEYVETVIGVMKQENVGGCLKHFPGYGENVNTHNLLAEDNRSLSEYEKRDFVPFRRGIEKGADMVMVAHIVMKDVDDKVPASLSAKVHRILREDMEFKGVIISDDLNMKALLNNMTIESATANALAAGNDMIFSADFQASMRGAKKAVVNGTLTEDQIEQSLKRILRMKLNYDLISIEK